MEKENGVYIIQDGKEIRIIPKNFGHDTLIWKNGRVLDVESSRRVRVNEQEEI
ncbi:DUF3954 domain-containing protein [Virgibacillus halophilus]|uniref:DUF3954 domain-containing protein n=1 Tax=Tigheibacillus halophilus TaxID=361280 RepID=A0ABU5CBT9_9BACI|nr:DUF3954 domain-containing protein [Virgibacillus halophilus]